MWNEIQELVHGASWPKFYDTVEAVLQELGRGDGQAAMAEINALFAEENLAWHVVNSEIVPRMGEASEADRRACGPGP